MASLETLTTRETANLLKASVRTIQLWVEDGRLKAWKTPGGHRRVLRTSVEEMLATRQRVSGADLRKYEILLVKGDVVERDALEKILAELGADTRLRVSSDAYEALIRIGETHPDLLLIDLHMPGVDGFQVLHTLAREAVNQPMRIGVLSALSAEELAAQGGLPDGVILLREPILGESLQSLAIAHYLAWRMRDLARSDSREF